MPARTPQTGASTEYAVGFGPFASSFHAAGTETRPAPCAYAGWSGRYVAELVSADRIPAGDTLTCEADAAESRTATAPAACGEAIDVPLNMP